MKGLFIYTGAKGCSKLNSAVFYTNSIFMLDKEWILVVKIVGNQSLAYYQLVYLKLFQCLRESVFPDESIDYTRKHWLSKVALKQFFVAVQFYIPWKMRKRSGLRKFVCILEIAYTFNYKIICSIISLEKLFHFNKIITMVELIKWLLLDQG